MNANSFTRTYVDTFLAKGEQVEFLRGYFAACSMQELLAVIAYLAEYEPKSWPRDFPSLLKANRERKHKYEQTPDEKQIDQECAELTSAFRQQTERYKRLKDMLLSEYTTRPSSPFERADAVNQFLMAVSETKRDEEWIPALFQQQKDEVILRSDLPPVF